MTREWELVLPGDSESVMLARVRNKYREQSVECDGVSNDGKHWIVKLPQYFIDFDTVADALSWWSGLIPLLSFLTLCSPVPFGCWRAQWEFQMYGMSIAVRYWTGKPINVEYMEKHAKEFTTSAYFWMYPYKNKTKEKLKQLVKDAAVGYIFNKPYYGKYYKDIYKTLKSLNLVVKLPIKEPV
jgi:hypothetical protein